MVHVRQLSVAVASAVCVLATPAAARSAWGPPVEAASSGEQALTGIDVAVNDRGEGVGVRTQRESERDASVLRFVDRRADGSWGPPGVVARDRDFVLGSAQAVVDGSGRATMSRTLRSGNVNPPTFLQVASRDPGGRWSRPVTLSGRYVGWLNSTLATVGPCVVVAWAGITDANSSRTSIESAMRDGSGRWRVLPRLGPEKMGTGLEPKLWPQADGSTALTFNRSSGRRGVAVSALRSTLPADGARWTPPAPLARTRKNSIPVVAVARTEETLVAHWGMGRVVKGVSGPSRLSVTPHGPDGRAKATAGLGLIGSFDTPTPRMGPDGSGVVVLSRTMKNYGASTLEAAIIPPGGETGEPTVIARRAARPGGLKPSQMNATEATPWNFSTEIDGTGRALLAWSVPRMDDDEPMLLSEGISVASHEPGRGWSEADEVVRFDPPALSPARSWWHSVGVVPWSTGLFPESPGRSSS